MEISAEHKTYIHNLIKNAKRAAVALRGADSLQKNRALAQMARLLDANREEIKIKNSADLEYAREEGLSAAMIDRLTMTDMGIDSMIESLETIIALTDPVGQSVEGKRLPNGLEMNKIRVPIGVVGIVYESRPNVTVDVGALGLKSSNAVILRGGKEAIHTNQCLARLFQTALNHSGLPSDAIQLIEHTERTLLLALIREKKGIDIIVPRGGEGLINFVTENSLVPVIKHDKGVCHIYVHPTADIDAAISVIINAKVQRPGVCNSTETLLLDKALPTSDQVKILAALVDQKVTLHADAKTRESLEKTGLAIEQLTDEGYHREYLSLDISVKLVDDMSHAISHIQEYSSGHSEAILATDYPAIRKFLQEVDSAALFVNTSTRFHDGGQFGYGAEVGISTQKLHVRGPMGLTDLTTTKYIVQGSGQIRP